MQFVTLLSFFAKIVAEGVEEIRQFELVKK
ncbi:hypothetical protein PSDI105340_08320 [Pseudoalteromonas distincta]